MKPATRVTRGHRVRLALKLWALGVWESLQLHRCIVLFALDNSRELWAGVSHCLVLNALLFAGTIAWQSLALRPATHFILSRYVTPCWGSAWSVALAQSLDSAFHLLLVLPVYGTTMLASSLEYSKVARAAHAVQQGRRRAVVGQQGPVATANCGIASRPKAAGGSSAGGFESVAQELYRVLLLSVYYVEVWLLGQVPYCGKALYLLSMAFLWAFYCFDYKWSLQAITLADRLDYFETHWCFFAGFGLIMSAATLLLPFYWGAACSAVLFPLCIVVACDSDPEQVHNAAGAQPAGGAPPPLGSLPVFRIAFWTCRTIVGAVVRP